MKPRKTIEIKSIKSSFGVLTLHKDLTLLQEVKDFKVSPFLKEKLVYIGQLENYGQSAEIASRLLGVKISDTSIYRMTDLMGELCGD